MIKCDCCKEVFEYPRIVSESRGEFWGMPAYEDMPVCPYCGSDEIYDEEDEEDDEDAEDD